MIISRHDVVSCWLCIHCDSKIASVSPSMLSVSYYTVVPDIIHSPIRYKNTLYATSKEAIAKWDIDDPISSQLPVVVTLQKK